MLPQSHAVETLRNHAIPITDAVFSLPTSSHPKVNDFVISAVDGANKLCPSINAEALDDFSSALRFGDNDVVFVDNNG